MGNSPSQPTSDQLEELQRRFPELTARAACALLQADVLLVCTGAGWSADSGLAVYRDVADVDAYRDRGLTYRDLCQPRFLEEEPAIFYGFWGGCYNDYRNVAPHEGYSIIKSWVEKKFKYTEAATALRAAQNESGADCAGAFFAYTSNVDAHWLSAGFQPHEVHEIHGNCEQWQCAERCTPQRWAAPPEHRFHVDETSRLAEEDVAPQVPPRGGASASQMADKPPAEKYPRPWMAPVRTEPTDSASAFAFSSNWPTCITCGGKARPAVLMFNDHKYQTDHK